MHASSAADIIPARLPGDWDAAIGVELEQPYMRQLARFLEAETAAGATVYPAPADRFRAFELTPLDRVRVVILGQDPYHGPGQAHGLSFSVAQDVRVPPSLANIFRELERDIGCPPPVHGDLSCWARQGVLLLNTALSVEAEKPGSHRGQGWERFTDAAIGAVVARGRPVVFLLWGKHALEKAALIDGGGAQLVLTAPHPSPLSAYRGFLGCEHFSRANAHLAAHGLPPIDWCAASLTAVRA